MPLIPVLGRQTQVDFKILRQLGQSFKIARITQKDSVSNKTKQAKQIKFFSDLFNFMCLNIYMYVMCTTQMSGVHRVRGMYQTSGTEITGGCELPLNAGNQTWVICKGKCP